MSSSKCVFVNDKKLSQQHLCISLSMCVRICGTICCCCCVRCVGLCNPCTHGALDVGFYESNLCLQCPLFTRYRVEILLRVCLCLRLCARSKVVSLFSRSTRDALLMLFVLLHAGGSICRIYSDNTHGAQPTKINDEYLTDDEKDAKICSFGERIPNLAVEPFKAFHDGDTLWGTTFDDK